MAVDTAIQWCDHTFNPWWGCARVSPACVHCYADTTATRYGHGGLWRKHGERRFFGEKHWAEPLKWDRDAAEAGVRRRVFCASMSDVFEEHPDARMQERMGGARVRLAHLIADTPNLDWLLLTKRVELAPRLMRRWTEYGWPTNVWLGTSVENQRWADERIPLLLNIPARVRFLSCEPLLGPVDLNATVCGDILTRGTNPWVYGFRTPGIGWIIAGGESGKGHRPSDLDWFRSLRDQCVAAGVPFLFKQWGGATSKSGGRELDGRTWDEFPAVAA